MCVSDSGVCVCVVSRRTQEERLLLTKCSKQICPNKNTPACFVICETPSVLVSMLASAAGTKTVLRAEEIQDSFIDISVKTHTHSDIMTSDLWLL